jgi:hypothetical protein
VQQQPALLQQVQLVVQAQMVTVQVQLEQALLALGLRQGSVQRRRDAQVFRCEQVIQLQFCRWKEQVPLRTSAQAEASDWWPLTSQKERLKLRWLRELVRSCQSSWPEASSSQVRRQRFLEAQLCVIANGENNESDREAFQVGLQRIFLGLDRTG